MSDSAKKVFFARNVADVCRQLSSVENLRVMAGCTQSPQMPGAAVIVRGLEELVHVERTERFIDIGSATPLQVILEQAQKHIPQTLYDAIRGTGTPFVRNLATLGGNICARGWKRSLFAPLYALDSILEFKSEKQTFPLPIAKFDALPAHSLLTKIQVPVLEWDVAIYKRLGPALPSETSAFFVFLAMAQKGFLSDIRIVFSARKLFRDRNLENTMVGTPLPLSRKNVETFLEQTRKSFAPDNAEKDSPAETDGEGQGGALDSPLAERQFLNLLSCSLEQLM
ncbi:MAG: FAD binding domain-containing protein [Spirochaetaceae bacterium]|jgi:CO/xanthine dehydrogenase FAD-binding subunit|nr:FAD binding domain-containing protein [Spirochaetaceae bacterium]